MTPDDTMNDDALLTAYALGELDDAERARVEALLAADPDARRAVDEARETAAGLERLLADEPAAELTPEQRERVAAASVRGRVFPLRPIAAVAATLVAALGVAALGTAGRSPTLDMAGGQHLRHQADALRRSSETARHERDRALALNVDPAGKSARTDAAMADLLAAAREQNDREFETLKREFEALESRAELQTATYDDSVLQAASAIRTIAGGSSADGDGSVTVDLHGGIGGGFRTKEAEDPLVGGAGGGAGGNAPADPGKVVDSFTNDVGVDLRGLDDEAGALRVRRSIRQYAGRDFSTVFSSFRLPPADGNPPSPQVVAEVWRRLREVNPDVSYDVAVAAIARARASAQPGSETYEPIGESTFREPGREPLSTFSIDVDTASYTNVRRFLEAGQLPPPDAVRLEEMVNYFSYDDPTPDDGQPFATRVEVAGCPWNTANRLVRIGLRAKDVGGELPPMNVVFLIDVSGSMQSDDKLPLLKRGMKLLADQMREQDRVGIVTYASNSGIALNSTNGAEKSAIVSRIDGLSAGGSTNGGAGIQQAYEMARKHFVKGGVNRVILATDGDFNVGITDKGDLVELIQREAESGVFLTVLGFGTGNIKDATLEQIADKGNGQYAYIDGLREARRVLVERMRGTLVTVAKDVKIQVEFNPARVASYRLIGYENRVLAAADFNDDEKDAGEIGSGHSVTALYEVVPIGAPPAEGVDGLRYRHQPIKQLDVRTIDNELLAVKLRYKQPDGARSTKIEIPVTDMGKTYAQASSDLKFAASVAMFGMLLRNSPTRGTASYGAILELGGEALGEDPRGYRAQFLDLVQKAKTLSGR